MGWSGFAKSSWDFLDDLHREAEEKGEGGDEVDEEGEFLWLSDREVSEFQRSFETLKLAQKFHVLSVESLVGQIHKAVEKRLWRLVEGNAIALAENRVSATRLTFVNVS